MGSLIQDSEEEGCARYVHTSSDKLCAENKYIAMYTYRQTMPHYKVGTVSIETLVDEVMKEELGSDSDNSTSISLYNAVSHDEEKKLKVWNNDIHEKERDTSRDEPNPKSVLTEEERHEISSYWSMIISVCTGRQDDIPQYLLTSLLQISLHGSPLSLQTAAQLDIVLQNRTRHCVLLLQELLSLPPSDQDQIIQTNLHMVHRFRQAMWWGGGTMYSSTWLVRLFMGQHKWAEEQNIPLDLSMKISSKPFTYSSLFSSDSYQSEEEEVLHKKLMKDISDNVDSEDEIEIVLIVLIIVFSPDYLDLKDHSKVEKLYLKFVLLLQSHYSGLYHERKVAGKLDMALRIPHIVRKIRDTLGNRIAL